MREPFWLHGSVSDVGPSMAGVGMSASPLRQEVLNLWRCLDNLRLLLVDHGVEPPRYQAIRQAIDTLRTALDAEFDVRSIGYHAANSSRPVVSRKRLQNQRDYQIVCRKRAEAKLKAAVSEKIAGRIQHQWFMQAILANPNVPARTLDQWFENFPTSETRMVSATYIGAVRDAWAEELKCMNAGAVTRYSAELGQFSALLPSDSATVFVQHIHDEAPMRFRSWNAGLFVRRLRGRSSKVQNNCMAIFIAGKVVDWLAELQPVAQKNGATIAACLIANMSSVINAIAAARGTTWSRARIIHLLIGDGVNTNENAAKRLWRYYQENTKWGGLKLKYHLIAIRCSSHQVNLVVVVAICGELLLNAVERNSICANATRLYKYLIRDYLEEFSANLKQHIADTMRVVGPDDPLVVDGLGRAKALQLQALYGCDTLPDDLLEVFNAGVSQWVHVSAAGLDAAALMSKALYILHKYILFIEEHPVPTRFWLYGKCVAGMLRMNLLGVPADIFRLRFVRPCEEGRGRLAKYTTWHCSPEAGSSLRIAALCLRLTTHALNITAQNHDGDDAREPTLLRLARGEVQHKTLQRLGTFLGSLTMDPD